MFNPQFFYTFASLSGASAVAFGAFGAHALKSRLTPNQQASWTTATTYQLLHSAVLLFAATQPATRAIRVSNYAFATGISLFSGSIYGLCLTKEGHGIRKVLGPLTPIGGTAMIVGWIALAFARRGAVRLG